MKQDSICPFKWLYTKCNIHDHGGNQENYDSFQFNFKIVNYFKIWHKQTLWAKLAD